MLSDVQKQYFETFGFLVLRQLFSQDEIDLIRRESDRILSANRQGEPFPGKKRQSMIPFFEKSQSLIEFMADDRIYLLGEELLGADFILNATEGNLHVGDTQWHGGGLEEEPLRHIKIAFYLEPNSKETGALRILPGSHKAQYSKYLQPLRTQAQDPTAKPFGLSGAEVPCAVFESQPGDIVVFEENTWHAAFGGSSGRSQHAISFQANPKNDRQVAYLKSLCDKYNYSLHPPQELVESDHPRLQRMVARLLELGIGPPAPTPVFGCA